MAMGGDDGGGVCAGGGELAEHVIAWKGIASITRVCSGPTVTDGLSARMQAGRSLADRQAGRCAAQQASKQAGKLLLYQTIRLAARQPRRQTGRQAAIQAHSL